MPTGAVIFGCAGLRLSAAEKAFFGRVQPWGFILFARNLDTPQQIQILTAELRAAVGRNALILIDQEGGRVARLRPPMWQGWLPPLDQQAHLPEDRRNRAMWLRYRLIAAELRALGIDGNCAPMLDIPQDGVHAIIRDRCYGTDVATVVAAGRAVADGLLAGGVLPVIKHIPGHGRPSADSHAELPLTRATHDELHQIDFAPFKALADLPLAMTAHVVYEAIDQDHCATLSPKMIALIRDEIGFDGLLMSDDLNMSALKGRLAQRCVAALSAGCDVILHCNGDRQDMEEVASAAGSLTAAAHSRAEAALAARKPAQPVDITALKAEFDRVMEGADHE